MLFLWRRRQQKLPHHRADDSEELPLSRPPDATGRAGDQRRTQIKDESTMQPNWPCFSFFFFLAAVLCRLKKKKNPDPAARTHMDNPRQRLRRRTCIPRSNVQIAFFFFRFVQALILRPRFSKSRKRCFLYSVAIALCTPAGKKTGAGRRASARTLAGRQDRRGVVFIDDNGGDASGCGSPRRRLACFYGAPRRDLER